MADFLGTPMDDMLRGTPYDDMLTGMDGDDVLSGWGGMTTSRAAQATTG